MYLRVTRGRFDPARYDEVMAAVPAVLAGLQQLPGCQEARAGIDRTAGTTISVSTFDTREHAQFSRDVLGDSLARLQAAGWQAEAPDLYEGVQQ